MKLCKDCKYYSSSATGEEYDKCLNGARELISPCTGKKSIETKYCEIERSYTLDGMCGPTGINFASKSMTEQSRDYIAEQVKQQPTGW